MSGNEGLLLALEAANRASPFHRVTGFRVVEAAEGGAKLAFEAAPDLLNHAGALHAGVQCAALDTAAGYAAATMAGPVVTLSFTTYFLSSAKGERCTADARVIKAGKNQLFVEADCMPKGVASSYWQRRPMRFWLAPADPPRPWPM